MLQKVIDALAVRNMKRDFDAYLRYLEASTWDELAVLLAAATGTRDALMKGGHLVGTAFPETAFRGGEMLTDKARRRLLKYNGKLFQMRNSYNRLADGGDFGAVMMSGGLTVWAFTFRALGYVELFPYGRSMWGRLFLGSPKWLDEMKEISPGMSDTEVKALWPYPNMLAPGIPGTYDTAVAQLRK